MTFDEIECSLPNGFHDAAILGISLDCVKSYALIRLSIHVSIEGDADRERYRIGLLEANSIHLFFLDKPDTNRHIGPITNGISASGDCARLGQDAEIDILLRKLPAGVSIFRFFMDDQNSFFTSRQLTQHFHGNSLRAHGSRTPAVSVRNPCPPD